MAGGGPGSVETRSVQRTGVILGGQPPLTAIKYQIAIMIAIFTGTAIAVPCGILLTLKKGFLPAGPMDRDVLVR